MARLIVTGEWGKFYNLCARKLQKTRLRAEVEKKYSPDPHLDDVGKPKTLEDYAQRLLHEYRGDRDGFHELTREAFSGAYHQAVFLLDRPPSAAGPIIEAARDARADAVDVLKGGDIRRGWGYLLLRVQSELECYVQRGDATHVERRSVSVPVLVKLGPRVLVVQVLTVSPSDWSPYLQEEGIQVKGSLQADKVRKAVTGFLRAHLGLGDLEALDYSPRAIEVLRSESVFVSSVAGHVLRRRGVGGTMRLDIDLDTGGGSAGIPEVFEQEFEEVLNSHSVRRAFIRTTDSLHGVPEGYNLYLHPSNGRLNLSASLQEGDLDGLISFFAS